MPDEWPPALVKDPDTEGGWWDWYVVKREDSGHVLVGVVGLRGWPAVSASVQAGCAFLDRFHNNGLAAEAFGAVTSCALEQPHVKRVTASTSSDNEAAKSVLRKLGFRMFGSDRETGMAHFEKSKI